MKATARLAALLLERLNIEGKPELPVVAAALGLRLREVESTGFEGALVCGKDARKGVVAVKASIAECTRKRFTIAHEIGHYVIPSHRNLENVCTADDVESWDKRLNPAEIEANEFAAELLLPEKSMRRSLCLADPSLRGVSNVAEQFETSLTATTRRFIDLTDLPCVMVWSTNRKAVWYHRSEAFPFYLTLQDIPHDASFAGRLFAGKSAPDDMSPVDPDCWLDRHNASKVGLLLEQSIFFRNYNSVLTLLYVADAAEPLGTYEDAEPLLEELNPEEFTLRRKKWPR